MVGGVVAALFIALVGGLAEHGWWVTTTGPTVCRAQAPGDGEVILPERCVQVCKWVAAGEVSWWDAFLLFGCWCDNAPADSVPSYALKQIVAGAFVGR